MRIKITVVLLIFSLLFFAACTSVRSINHDLADGSVHLLPNEEQDFSPKTNNNTARFIMYDVPPRPIERKAPSIPRYRVSGTVLLEVEILTDGSVGEIRVAESLHPGKDGPDEMAIKAVKQWKFSPALASDRPIATQVRIPITFSFD